MGCFFTGNNISIGENTVVNRNCYLDGRYGIEIGNNVSLSPEVYLLSLTHDLNDPHFSVVGKKTTIGDYVWIGARAMIMPGVCLNIGCVVGAGTIVTKSFDSNKIIVGIPGKVIGERKRNYSYSLKYFPYFNTDITR
jgi:maltose O-acetyltransferase